MYYYGFVIHFDFEEKEVSKLEFESHAKRKVDRHFDRTLHNRGADSFAFVSPYVSNEKEPYIDKMLDVFLEEMIRIYRRMKDFINEKKGEISITIVYDNVYKDLSSYSEEEREMYDLEDHFKGYRISPYSIHLLDEMKASIDCDAGRAKYVID